MATRKLSDHFLVPKHEIVPEDKVQEVFGIFNAKRESLPRILGDDPVVKEIGAKSGDLVKITRKSPTAGTSIYYRMVVK